MKAAEYVSRCDSADALNSPMDWSILVQSAMGPYAVVACSILAKDPAQEHHESGCCLLQRMSLFMAHRVIWLRGGI